ncbi:MAG: tetratricopeptide repeat protein [Anaerolineae bacterium]|nr:tetratricopeptide repeat protein [Anaerolineae bacterium]
MAQQTRIGQAVAIAPLIGSQQTDEANWLGALLSKLFIEHLIAAGLPTIDYNTVAGLISTRKLTLPLPPDAVQAIRTHFKLQTLVHGRYILDQDAKMLGVRLVVDGLDSSPAPLEASTPLAGFSRFVERISLALIERLNVPIDDALRQRVKQARRPAAFEAFRQLSLAQAAWHRNQHELALAAVSSALALDADYEEAVTLEVAISRAAGDTTNTLDAFRRWSAIAAKRGDQRTGAERLILLGHWLFDRGEWDNARRAYEDAQNLFQQANDEVGTARALNNLASLTMLREKHQAAIKTYRRSLRTFETMPDAQGDLAITLFNLSQAHKEIGQTAEALTAIDQVITKAQQKKDMRLEAHCLAQRAAIRHDGGEWGQANEDYRRAANLFDVLGDEMGLATVKSHQAILFKQQGNYDRAEALMLEAQEVYEKDASPYYLGVLWLNLADLYFSMTLYEQAWTYAEQAVDTLSGMKVSGIEQAQELLATIEGLLPQEDETTIDEQFDLRSLLPDAGNFEQLGGSEPEPDEDANRLSYL